MKALAIVVAIIALLALLAVQPTLAVTDPLNTLAGHNCPGGCPMNHICQQVTTASSNMQTLACVPYFVDEITDCKVNITCSAKMVCAKMQPTEYQYTVGCVPQPSPFSSLQEIEAYDAELSAPESSEEGSHIMCMAVGIVEVQVPALNVCMVPPKVHMLKIKKANKRKTIHKIKKANKGKKANLKKNKVNKVKKVKKAKKNHH